MREAAELILRVVSFQLTQPLWSRRVDDTDGQTTYGGNIGLCCTCIARQKGVVDMNSMNGDRRQKQRCSGVMHTRQIRECTTRDECNRLQLSQGKKRSERPERRYIAWI